jgi:hypothetical protein
MAYPVNLLIAGELRSGRGAGRTVENRATGEVLVEVPDADLADVEVGSRPCTSDTELSDQSTTGTGA